MPDCGGWYKPMGMGSHMKKYKKTHDTAAEEDQFITGLLAKPQHVFLYQQWETA